MKLMNWFKFGMVIMVISVSVMACVNDGTELLEDEDVVELLENALNSKSGGFDTQITDMLALVNTYKDDCDATIDSSYSKEKGIGTFTYNYTYDFTGTVNCDSATNIPSNIVFNYTTLGLYSAPRMSSSDEGTYNVTVNGIETGSANYDLVGSYTRIGTQTTRIRTSLAFTATLGVSLNSLLVDKTTRDIQSGGGAFTVTGETSGGESIGYEGTIMYNNDNTATINLNGKDYTIDLD
jgi:hypothetical protein